MKTEFIPVAIIVHLALPLIAYLSVRNQSHDQQDQADIFRYAPGAAWFVLISAIAIMTVSVAIAWTAAPGHEVHLLTFGVVETAFFSMSLYGIYLITLRIRVEDLGFTTSSFFGKRVVPFDQIGSATDRVTGSYRTLDVKTLAGKRVLYVESSYLLDYAALADLIQYGAKHSRTLKSGAEKRPLTD